MSGRKKAPRLAYTGKSADRSVAEIVKTIGRFGADSIHQQWTGGRISSIAFVAGGVAYRLTPNVAGLERRLDESGQGGKDPHAVAWAQLAAWVEFQLEIIENGTVTTTEAFGGFALAAGGRTVAELIDESRGEFLPGDLRLLPGWNR